jgi:hypothetical protein
MISMRYALIPGLLLAIGACSSTSKGRVVMTEGGTLTALGTAKDEGAAMITAVDAADNYCKKQQSIPVFPANSFSGAKESQDPKFDLSRIPFLKNVLKSDDSLHVLVNFRCSSKAGGA